MGVTIQSSGQQNCDQKNKVILIPITLAVFILVLAMGAGSAWSFDQIGAGDVQEDIKKSTKNFSNSSSPGIVDGCLPLLKSIREPHASTAMNPNQRSAGQAAALGLVFGFRFALEPTRKSKSPKPRLDVWEHHGEIAGNRHALAIADYRRCQKEKALKSSIQALQDFRWTR